MEKLERYVGGEIPTSSKFNKQVDAINELMDKHNVFFRVEDHMQEGVNYVSEYEDFKNKPVVYNGATLERAEVQRKTWGVRIEYYLYDRRSGYVYCYTYNLTWAFDDIEDEDEGGGGGGNLTPSEGSLSYSGRFLLSNMGGETQSLFSANSDLSNISDTGAKKINSIASVITGNLDELDESVASDNLVGAINKAAQQGGGGTVEHEKVRIIVSTSAEGVSVSGLDIYVYYNDDTRNPVKVTTDERGMCALQVPADYRYRVVFPDIEGCNPIPDVVHTAVLRERSIEVEYKAADEIKEIATIHVRKYVQGVSQPWSGQKVTVTIGGNDAEYTTNANGIVEIEVPVGTEYTASVNPIEGMYVHGNLSHTYVAEHTVRNIYFDYHDMEVGLFLVDKNGAEYTYDEWVASGKDGSDAVFIKFAEASLLADNAKGVFSILIDDVVNAVYTTKKTWCNQNVLFNNIPPNGSVVTAQYYYDGKGATTAIIDEAHERGLFVDAADYCWGKTYELNNGETLQGFLWSIGQNRVMFNNVTPLNAMIALVRPSATKNFTNLVATNIWTSAQDSAGYAYYVSAGVNSSSKSNNYGVLPCYAP